jgi:cytochrome c-type biogenesis protein
MEGANVYTALIAFVGGLASFLSPCVLPLVPGYISLISGVSVEHLKGEGGSQLSARRAVVVNSLAFNAGLSIIFLTLGAAAGLIGSALFTNKWVGYAAGLVIILFGLQLMGVLKIRALYSDTRKFSEEKPRGAAGSLLLGIAFAAGWTPCIGPFLAGLLALASQEQTVGQGSLLLFVYGLGLGVPFVLTGVALGTSLRLLQAVKARMHALELVSGFLLVGMGLLIFSDRLSLISVWLTNVFGNGLAA